jgi:prepilin-type N-terminal cleavage/methylation domain-containing protein
MTVRRSTLPAARPRTAPSAHRAVRAPRGFTLIELLVVVAVIALLIGILLPALGRGREVARQTVCQSNLGQMAKAAATYAIDWKDLIWPQFDWTPLPYNIGAGTQTGRALLYQYVDNVDEIAQCPTNKRRNLSGRTGQNAFGGETGVNFDYTMFGRIQGLKVGATIFVARTTAPQTWSPGAKPPVTLPQTALLPFADIPLYVEESPQFNNSAIGDGLWGNSDQVAQTHFKTGNVSFVGGSAGVFKVPQGPDIARNESEDFDTNDLYAASSSQWVRIEPTDVGNGTNWRQRPYGWINSPRP